MLCACDETTENQNPSKCFEGGNYCCFNPVTEKCMNLNVDVPGENDYENMKLKFKDHQQKGNAFFEQIQCKHELVKCRQKNSNDIEENCHKKILIEGTIYKCCYMTLDFKYNNKHECYPVIPDKDKISNVIDTLEAEYDEVKRVKIKCDNINFIKITYFLLFNILFLI